MLESGRILAARFGLLRKLGQGRATQVWQARDLDAAGDCVLKVLIDPSPAAREQFLRAARMQQQLRHPRLQRCESVHDGEPPFAVFAEVANGDLATLRGRPWQSLLPVLAGVAEGLAALHARGLVHRDLKPANVLLTAEGAPVIADFGLAAPAGDAGAPRGGSPFAMSPQQLDGLPPEPADDVYAFGALAHELITGYPPFYPDPQPDRIRSEPPAPVPASFGIPAALEALLQSCLAKSPGDRPGDLGAVAASLRELLATPAEPSPRAAQAPVALRPPAGAEPAIAPQWTRSAPAGPTPQQLRSEGFRRGLVAATLVILLLGAGFVFFLLPDWVERRAPASASVEPPAAPVAAAPVPPELDKDFERLAEAKREFEELRPAVAKRLEGLEARTAGAWGGETFARGKRTFTEADAAFGRREHEAALASLRAADADFAATEKLAAEQLRAALGAGATALEQGDAATARARFERALQIDPENAVAKRGLERVATLGEVTTLLAEARAAEERGDRAAAEAAYRRALALDGDARAAREGLARLQAQAGNAAFASAMSQGLDALARGDHAAARAAFERAGQIRPGATEVADGLAQVERALGARALAAHIEAAQQAERGERWAEALAEYRKALAIDRNLLLAQQGVERAEPRAMLDAELASYLERPERLFSPDVRAAARATIARARSLDAPGPALGRRVAGVEALITAAETPQRVALTSDNQTDVTVYRVGRIGTFERKELELLPGRYTVVGMRAGYRDVRREFTLLPGREAPTLAIRCEEPI